MNQHQLFAEKLLEKYQYFESHPDQKPHCLVGFDGFTDEIITLVDKRYDATTFDPIRQMKQFGERLVSAAGKSCNIEMVVKEKRLGGNAPLMTRGLVEGGHRVVFIGAIGVEGQVEPLFQPIVDRCERAISLCASAHTDALEFEDGKVFMGKIGSLLDVNRETLLKHLSLQQWIALLDKTDLFACANWTMLPMMTDIWKWVKQEIVPHLSKRSPRWLFVDLADPAKRMHKDLLEALQTLRDLNSVYSVVLGLNQAEAERVALVLGLQVESMDPESAKALAQEMRKKLALSQIVIHLTASAVAASPEGEWVVEGPFCSKPRITTGGGDHFNAGYCTALLYGFSPEEALLAAVYTSGYYVRFAHSPTMPQLASFLDGSNLGGNSESRIQNSE